MSRSENSQRSHRASMTAVWAVILLISGIAAVLVSVQMQESQIHSGAEKYDALAIQLKAPAEVSETAEDILQPSVGLFGFTESPLPDAPSVTAVSARSTPLSTSPEVAQTLLPTASPSVQQVVPPSKQPIPTVNNPTGANMTACKAVNKAFIGWLQIPGTKVDYPVVLTNDVSYYLNHTFTRQESIIGCLFSLGKTDYQRPSQNIAVYGHHMRRSRATTMFQPLHEYKRRSFRDAHSTIRFDTLYGNRCYTVFAVINKRESDWDASAADFASPVDFQAFIDRAKAWSFYDTGVEVSADDHILTLITCDRDYHKEDGQLVVMAVEN